MVRITSRSISQRGGVDVDWTDYTEVEERFFSEHGREPTPEELEEYAVAGMSLAADRAHDAYRDRGIP